jgi:hypothetical protein
MENRSSVVLKDFRFSRKKAFGGTAENEEIVGSVRVVALTKAFITAGNMLFKVYI